MRACVFMPLLFPMAVALELMGSPLLYGLQDTFTKAYPDHAAAQIAEALMAGLRRAASDESYDLEDVACDRDYSGNCPSGWLEKTDGVCGAPGPYHNHMRARTLDLRGMTPQEKRANSLEHNAEYACRSGSCGQDFMAPCPDGWSTEGRVCVASESYTGTCIGRRDFTAMGIADRKVWAELCGIQWPCRSSVSALMRVDKIRSPSSWFNSRCAMSFAEDCPARWTKHGKYCKAPSVRATPPRCGYIIDLHRLSPRQKEAWAAVCGEPWPASCDP